MGVSDRVRRTLYRAVKPRLLHVFHHLGPETGLSLALAELAGSGLGGEETVRCPCWPRSST
ncbi:hypothetical protein [Nonomuraea sp. NPDC049758]|uniref:hypothetical protein n=1 Tax=Nonomuraea sp. NPDC049758 TaxID=3154360 RepID=UPI0034329876